MSVTKHFNLLLFQLMEFHSALAIAYMASICVLVEKCGIQMHFSTLLFSDEFNGITVGFVPSVFTDLLAKTVHIYFFPLT